jgi:hypothetical protein
MLWRTMVGAYFIIGVVFGLLFGLAGATQGDWRQLRPDRLATSAIFWPFLLIPMIWAWFFARKEGISLDETAHYMRLGAAMTETKGWLARHPNATEEERRVAGRQIAQKHGLGQ